VNGGFFVSKMVATGFRVRPRGEGSKEEVRWKWGMGVGKRGRRVPGPPCPIHDDEAIMDGTG